jgi:hypothetical protein
MTARQRIVVHSIGTYKRKAGSYKSGSVNIEFMP